MKLSNMLFVSLCSLTMIGCAKDLKASGVDDAGMDGAAHDRVDSSIPERSGNFTHQVTSTGVNTVVDATSNTQWHYLDLETGNAVTDATSTTWDVAFQRFKVITNGGVSGPGGVLTARVTGVSFDALTQTPESAEWIADVPDNDSDRDDTQDSAFTNGTDDWYLYEGTTHVLTPRTDVVYIVRTHEDGFFKIQITRYYDNVGTPAFLGFKWAPVLGPTSALPDAGSTWDGALAPDAAESDAGVVTIEPTPGDAIVVDATSRDAWTYYDLSTMSVVTVSDPFADATWDIAFQRTLMRTNSGTSGSGNGGARIAMDGVTYETVTTVPMSDYVIDTESASGTPGSTPTSTNDALSDWYDYDFDTHTVTAKQRVFAVRDAAGDAYAKLRVWGWVDGTFTLSIDAVSAE